MKNVGVFLGSSSGNDPIYQNQARLLGEQLAKKNIGVVYGGGTIGLMGALAKAVIQNNGNLIGIIPQKINKVEAVIDNATKLIVTEDMSTRKVKMTELSDSFVILAGGFGTLDELFEVLTLGQLNYHQKTVSIININGYFDHLLKFIEHSSDVGFIAEHNLKLFKCFDSVAQYLESDVYKGGNFQN